MQTQHSTTDEPSISARINHLLQRCDRLKRASTLKPTQFNARGQAHANRIAQQDRNPQ